MLFRSLFSLLSLNNSYFLQNKATFEVLPVPVVDIEDNNLVICINSILRYHKYEAEFFNNYVVYIDEINIFTRH